MKSDKSWAGVLLIVALLSATIGCSTPESRKRKHLQAGDDLVAKQQYDAATIEYRLALQDDPKSGDTFYRLAEAQAATENLPAALESYARAADLLPDNIDVQVKTGTLLLVARRYEDAKTRARAVLEKDPNSVPGLILLGNALAAMQDLENAIQVTQKAALLDPERAGAMTNLGVLQLASGARKDAEASFKQAIAVGPKSLPARLALANFYAAGNQIDAAERAFKEALAIAPTDVRVNRSLGSLYIAAGRPLEARPYLQTAAETQNTPEGWVSLADYYIAIGQSPTAVEILNRVPESSPASSPAALRVVLVTYASGQHEEAMRMLKDIQRKDPRNAIPSAFEAKLLLAERRSEEALAAARQAVSIDPGSAEANLMLGRVLASRGLDSEARAPLATAVRLDPRLVDAHLELARLHIRQTQIDTSIGYAEQGVKYAPGRLDARLSLVRALIARPETLARGEAEMKALLAAHPASSEVQVMMGALMVQKNALPEARRYFTRALELNPRSVAGLSGLTALDARADRIPDAAARIDARLAMFPKDPGLLLMAAKFYGLQSDRPRTEALLKRLIDVDPAGLEGYNLLGQMYAKAHELDRAKVQFLEMARREPNSEMAAGMLGLLYQAENNLPEADKWYSRALAINPRGVLASNNLAWISVTTGKLDYALQLARNAAAMAGDLPEINDTLGWVYFKSDQPFLAVAPLEKAVQRGPEEPVFHYHLGLVYAKLGNDALARASLDRALKLNPSFAGADDARRVMKTLVY